MELSNRQNDVGLALTSITDAHFDAVEDITAVYGAVSEAAAKHAANQIAQAIERGDRVLADAIAASFRESLSSGGRLAIAKSALHALWHGPDEIAASVARVVSRPVATTGVQTPQASRVRRVVDFGDAPPPPQPRRVVDFSEEKRRRVVNF
jgi:chloramphenicol 3-O-phosphotransferase